MSRSRPAGRSKSADKSLRRPLAQLVFGSVQEAGMAIAHADDQAAKRADLAPALRWMLDALFRDRAGPAAGERG